MDTLIGGLLVIAGVVTKNSLEQLKMPDNMIGPALFVIGWSVVAYSLADKTNWFSQKSIQAVAAPAAIVIAVFTMKARMKAGEEVGMLFPALFAGGWLLLGYTAGMGKDMYAMGLGLGASALVLLSMMWILPMQRENCVVDGPGMSMFTLAWVSLAAANFFYQ